MLSGHGPGHLQNLGSQTPSGLLSCLQRSSQRSIPPRRHRSHGRQVSRRDAEGVDSKALCHEVSSFSRDEDDEVSSFREGVKLPTQGESLVKGVDSPALQLQERERDDGQPDFMFLSVGLLSSLLWQFSLRPLLQNHTHSRKY